MIRRMLLTTAFLGLAGIAEGSDQFTVVLHARTPAGSGACTAVGLPNCTTIRPTTEVAPGAEFRLFIFINNFDDIEGFQTSFTWPDDWVLDPDREPPVLFGCRPNCLPTSEPSGPGPVEGTVGCVFDCFTGPALCIFGRMDFQAGASGCLTQINPSQGSQRVQMVDCDNRSYRIDAHDPLQQRRLGSICAGTPGRDACDAVTAVEPSTWGAIRASYR